MVAKQSSGRRSLAQKRPNSYEFRLAVLTALTVFPTLRTDRLTRATTVLVLCALSALTGLSDARAASGTFVPPQSAQAESSTRDFGPQSLLRSRRGSGRRRL